MKTQIFAIIYINFCKVIPTPLQFIFLSILLIAFTRSPNITLFTIGDSTMANKSTGWDNPEFGWGQLLKTYFDSSKVTVENHAKDGRSTKSFLREGRWDTVMSRIKPGDYVLIQFGHNDQKKDQQDLYTSPENYKANLTKFINDTRYKEGNPILITSIVRRKFDQNGKLIHTLEEYPDIMRKLAKELNIPLIDLEAKTRKQIFKEGPERSKNLYIHLKEGQHPAYPRGREDNTHLSKTGAIMVSQMFTDELIRLKIPIKKFLVK